MYMSNSEGMSAYGLAGRIIFTGLASSSAGRRGLVLLGRTDCPGTLLLEVDNDSIASYRSASAELERFAIMSAMVGDVGPFPGIPSIPPPVLVVLDANSKPDMERSFRSVSSPRALLRRVRGCDMEGDRSGGSRGSEGLVSLIWG